MPSDAGLAYAEHLTTGPPIALEVERTVDAPPERVWEVLRDYRVARAWILTSHFSDYLLHGGGCGAGTTIGYRLRVGAVRRSYVVGVEEPTPGRQLRERGRASTLLMTWTLTPGGEGERTVVRLDAVLRDRAGRSWWARARTRRGLRRLGAALLARLDAYLAGGGDRLDKSRRPSRWRGQRRATSSVAVEPRDAAAADTTDGGVS